MLGLEMSLVDTHLGEKMRQQPGRGRDQMCAREGRASLITAGSEEHLVRPPGGSPSEEPRVPQEVAHCSIPAESLAGSQCKPCLGLQSTPTSVPPVLSDSDFKARLWVCGQCGESLCPTWLLSLPVVSLSSCQE